MRSIPVKERAIRNGYSNVATARIAVAAKIDRSYSPGGTNSHPYQYVRVVALVHTNLRQRHLDRFSRFCRTPPHGLDQRIDTQTKDFKGRQDVSKNSPCMRRCGLKTTTQRNARLYVRRRRVSYNE